MSWKEMIQVERGADITEMEAPIPSTIGVSIHAPT